MKTISRDELKRRMDNREDILLVEVLAPEYYRDSHLPGAINVPVDERFEQRIQEAIPETSRPIVVYGYSRESTASEEAAGRMEDLGYANVMDYAEGKTDWRASGLPTVTEHVEAGS